ncbi:hypothetical protein [Armatimonas sp.]|uniref:hypothetical protein n=1 Tax=Armatimonas sp. TaxID=1872638 RepID=UPI00286A83D2|nr:hypothetical protein [Armatimonas sp.]
MQPLTERHWSNLIAWVLDPLVHSGQSLAPRVTGLLELAEVSGQIGSIEKVERERPVTNQQNARIIDLDLHFTSGCKVWIENKVDRSYEDSRQLEEERNALGPDDHLILLCPRGMSLLQQRTREVLLSDPRLHHIRWLDLAGRWRLSLPGLASNSREFQIIQTMADYWERRAQGDFLWQVETIVEEYGWSRFYPDDFKAAFCQRFADVYQSWVVERGERGLGGTHSYLLQQLVGLTKKNPGQFRLAKTGNERPPYLPDWGHPIIFEYQVLND